MNKERRYRLCYYLGKISEITQGLEGIRDEEQEAYDNLPEGLESSKTADKLEEGVETLEDIISELEGIDTEAASNL